MNRRERRANASAARQANAADKNHLVVGNGSPKLVTGADVPPPAEGAGLHILAENRGKAAATFCLHVFNKEPKYNRSSPIHQLDYDFKKEEGYLFTVEATGPTHPGYAFKLSLELAEAIFEENELGPKAWFMCEPKIRGVFYLHYLVLNGKNLLAKPGIL